MIGMTKNGKRRLLFGLAALLLLTAEVLIALFVHDGFVRPYLGDVLVVMLLYCLVRSIAPTRIPLLPLWLFLFAAAVETGQALHVIDWLGWRDNAFLRTLMGTAFSWWDMLCYAVGCAVCVLPESFFRKGEKR